MDVKWVSKVCLGGRSEPATFSAQLEVPPLTTGACATCGGRFHLDAAGLVPPHRIPVRRYPRPMPRTGPPWYHFRRWPGSPPRR